MPDFDKTCGVSEDAIINHQDSFAADYRQYKNTRPGMAIKFAELHANEVRIIAIRMETLKGSGKPEFIQ